MTHPEPSGACRRLATAVAARQERQGGGRQVGRTLPTRLDRAGFDEVAPLVVPQAAYGASRPGDRSRELLVQRFAAERRVLIDGGFISAHEFEQCLDGVASETIVGACTVECHLAVVGRRR